MTKKTTKIDVPKDSRGLVLYPPGFSLIPNEDGSFNKLCHRDIAIAAISGPGPVPAPNVLNGDGESLWGFIRIDDSPSLTNQDRVREFHETFLVEMAETPTLPSPEIAELRVKLIQEEFDELKDAIAAGDLVEVADALADILYVTYGAGLVCGIDLDACLREVHRSNMSKLDENGNPIFREDGKVMKGPNYTRPDLSSIVKTEA